MPSDAAPLIVRTLDLLARGSATGTVVVASASRTGSISVIAGRIAHVEAAGAAPLIGELLGIDGEGHGREGWIGERLRRKGIVTGGAITGAHREQMRARLALMMSWRQVSVTLRAGTPRAAPGVDPALTADLVVEALRRTVVDVPIALARDRLAAHAWALTPLGRSLAARAALHPDEAALVALLASPADLARIEQVTGNAPRAIRFAYALAFIDAAALPSEAGSMTLLARKTTEVRRAASATQLLDLPAYAQRSEARGALRKLARDLHPDRFAAHGSPAIQEASTVVVAAMTRAAASVGRT